MLIRLVKATLDQKPIITNLCELRAYDLTEQFDFDIGDDGFYGYKDLHLFWEDSNRHPFLIYCNDKIAGFCCVQKGSPIANNASVWDMTEFFIMKKYKRQGVGSEITSQIWQQFPGQWQIRVYAKNTIATQFWHNVIRNHVPTDASQAEQIIDGYSWTIFTFEVN
jgi:predicted acetyltransferase